MLKDSVGGTFLSPDRASQQEGQYLDLGYRLRVVCQWQPLFLPIPRPLRLHGLSLGTVTVRPVVGVVEFVYGEVCAGVGVRGHPKRPFGVASTKVQPG